MQKTVTLSAALAALAVMGGSALAQAPPPPPPAHHGIFSKLFHPKPGQPATGSFGRPGGMMGRPGMGGMMPMRGGVVGNKNTHVYHLPGDRGALPAPQNRVYFRSAAAAEAAGYHRAGGAHSAMGRPMSRPMMHGSPTHGMPGGMTR